MTDFSKLKFPIKKSPFDERDFKFRSIYKEVTLPRVVDYEPYMLPVRDQEDTPECAAFAASSMQQCRDTKEMGLTEYLSPQFIYNNREDPTEEGMYNRDLMKILQSKGVCLERLYRFRSESEPPEEAKQNALNHRSNNYAFIDYLDELKQALYIKGPGIIAVNVYNFTERMWYQRPGDYNLGGHDMCYVGYNDNTQKIKILNSWGSEFGDNGYIYMDYSDFSLTMEWVTNVDLPSIKTTTSPPEPTTTGTETTTQEATTTKAPDPKKKSWFIRNLWWMLVTAIGITVTLILVL